ncbi:MAG: hypothetical protein EOO46_21040 [Flavobacterium sp.]|nr:MAG: hypothetical protein EOO46_21040 [Flavobacterium sp.]
MRKSVLKGIVVFVFCLSNANAQSIPAEEIYFLIKDAIFFTDKYVTPATDAAVYQAASGWANTPKKANRWDFTLGLHGNVFFVPQSDRSFRLSNSDLSFFKINKEGVESALTPSTLGNDQYIELIGELNGSPVTLRTPEGIDREVVFYPYLQGSLGVGYGTEFIGKFSPMIKLKNVDYQVYGLGVKHNLSQYFSGMEKRNLHLSILAAYSKEDLTVNFLDVQTSYGNLGLNALNSLIDTWQFQVNASKEFKKLELSAGFIMNTSDFEYKVNGPKGEIERITPLQDVLNGQLKSIARTNFNGIGEISGRYQFSHFYIQQTLAFGKFANSNTSLQYEF